MKNPMSNAKKKSVSIRKVARILVVYGFDEDKKPRAAKFSEPEFELARKAADLMKLNVFEGDAIKLRRALKNLRAGNIYASGWAFVPSVRQNQFDALVAKLTSIKSETIDGIVDTGLPVSWDSIAIGQTVLGQADSSADGWWPAHVVDIDGDMLVLRARDFPKTPKVVRHRSAVALFFTKDFVAPEHDESAAPGLPVSWAKLAVGHLVIAQDAKAENGWWEAEIVEINGEKLKLRWKEFPRQPNVTRMRTSVALLNPVPPQAS
jgi:hypothetical protein